MQPGHDPVQREAIRGLENGAQDPDRRKSDHDEQERKSQDITHALLLHSAGCFGFVEVNLVALTFHRRLLEVVTWVDAEGATGAVQRTDGSNWLAWIASSDLRWLALAGLIAPSDLRWPANRSEYR